MTKEYYAELPSRCNTMILVRTQYLNTDDTAERYIATISVDAVVRESDRGLFQDKNSTSNLVNVSDKLPLRNTVQFGKCYYSL
jgi:hypothetical protein